MEDEDTTIEMEDEDDEVTKDYKYFFNKLYTLFLHEMDYSEDFDKSIVLLLEAVRKREPLLMFTNKEYQKENREYINEVIEMGMESFLEVANKMMTENVECKEKMKYLFAVGPIFSMIPLGLKNPNIMKEYVDLYFNNVYDIPDDDEIEDIVQSLPVKRAGEDAHKRDVKLSFGKMPKRAEYEPRSKRFAPRRDEEDEEMLEQMEEAERERTPASMQMFGTYPYYSQL